MADDSLIYGLGALGGVLFIFVIFYVGRLFDMDFRCRQMRRWLKQNYIIVNRVQKNGLTVLRDIINADADVVFNKNWLWAYVYGKIYSIGMREGIPVKQLIDEALHNGTEPIDLEKRVIWESGTPNIYVDSDSLIPLTFHKQDGQVKPDEIGSAINAWNAVQKAKMLAQVDEKKIFAIATLLLALGALAFGFINWQTLDELNNRSKGIEANIAKITPGSNVVNGTLNINQPKGLGYG